MTPASHKPPPSRSVRAAIAVACLALGAFALPCRALYDAAKEYTEAPAVAARYPDVGAPIATPAFKPGKADFTSQEDLMAFVAALAARTPALRVRLAGRSQEGRAIPLLVFAQAASANGGDLLKNGKPTVLVIGQQHGNEPAGSEAALALADELAREPRSRVLERVNVLIVPRANPDGAHHFARGLANGADVNRDHLIESTPEGRALGQVFTEFQPDVVLDCHEFGVKTRWFEKFQALQGYDALIQYATVSNLPAALTDASERMFRGPLLAALDAAGLRTSWYYTSAYDVKNLTVSMGGVSPDTGRNVAGLRNAISFLIETRGVGIGRAHFQRRVRTHLVAMNAMIDAAARNGEALLALGQQVRRDVAAAAGAGDVVVAGVATPGRHVLDMIDPETGADKHVEVDWRSALAIEAKLVRRRPYAYALPASEATAAARLRALGATVLRLDADADVRGERYRITEAQATKKDDVRRNDDEGTTDITRLATQTEPATIALHGGDFYVPLDQPLANLVIAALEPDTQTSFAANHLLTLPPAGGLARAMLPLYRLAAPATAPMTVWTGD